MTGRRSEASPAPCETLVDEDGSTNCWLVAAWDEPTIRDEYDWLFDDDEPMEQVYFRCRWTTPEELADEDFLYYQFGDHEMNGVDTSVVVTRCKADHPDAHAYWTTEP